MNPLLLPVGRFGRIDELLYPGALGKVALVLFPAGDNLLQEVLDQAAVEGRVPCVISAMTGIPVLYRRFRRLSRQSDRVAER